ncbi:uncharacterized protein F5891DRAFT_1193626 [Suillus fuscotomentosus]|uniref:Uncharacterized protein n=1 Tax=Suillus fuscotomentosus TaxID=1912939 RepID=A0AAD4HGU5_9AGAM|nr:uncharacterized protein F5891DRAFT_1193626 [Suillus fuscotomentosus]KAG1895992.1 hypothetical protein F5891DRAFT_1193626 [Suillus fuscotomentosus]
MPHSSTRQELLDIVDQATLLLAKLQYQDILDDWSDLESDSDSDSEDLLSSTSDDDDTISLSFSSSSPPSPLSPMTGISNFSSDDSVLPYDRLQDTIDALRDEVKRACVLHKHNEPPP